MELYFNEDAAWEPEDESYTRGIPSGYEQLLELADIRGPVNIEDEDTGMIQKMVDGQVYGFLEKKQDPFTEYILEIGKYERDSLILEDVKWIEQEHIQDTAKVVRTGSKRFTQLQDIRTRMMEDRWNSKLIDMNDIKLEEYTPIH